MNFARIFDFADIGQVCVLRMEADDGTPECRFYVEPPELGVCSIGYGFTENESGFDKRDDLYENLDSEQVYDIVKSIPGIWP